jgi:hypothetical protein
MSILTNKQRFCNVVSTSVVWHPEKFQFQPFWKVTMNNEGYNKSRLKSSFRKFYSRNDDLVTNYHWPTCWMICFIQFVRLTFPYWPWRRVIPHTWFRLRVHVGCDRSAEDAYSSMAPDPNFAFVGGPCCPIFDFVIAFWIMIYVLRIVNFAFLYSITLLQRLLNDV